MDKHKQTVNKSHFFVSKPPSLLQQDLKYLTAVFPYAKVKNERSKNKTKPNSCHSNSIQL